MGTNPRNSTHTNPTDVSNLHIKKYSKNPSMDELVDASSAAVGQVVGTFATFPLDVVKTKLQASSIGSKQKRKSLFEVLVEENLFRMYLSKFPTKALQQGSSRFTYYFIYSFVQRVFRRILRKQKLGTNSLSLVRP